ncbi:MAG: lipoprotein-releasing ABC transporter permease subunit [Alphaproteobacteria bacterium]|jgi:lipoprotein-releasing system permease protein|nr:lipoprotein-releasing ABC transporter permease subunit [Alphaproteobacteria bacterium]
MFQYFERKLALRYLRAKRKESFISVIGILSFLGILLGMATLIIVMSVMNGFRDDFQDRILGLNGHFQITDMGHPLEKYEDVMKKISQLSTVKAVYPFIESQALATSNNNSQGVMVRAMSMNGFMTKTKLLDSIVSGPFELKNFTGRKAIVGALMARNFGLSVGDQFTVISPKMMATAFGSVPRQMVLEVAAVFRIGMYEYDQSFVFVPFATAQQFFDMGQSVTSLEVLIYDINQTEQVGNQIYPLLGPYQDLRDWKSSSGFLDALMVERIVMFIILTLMILIAALNIISGMIMLVKDKGKDIAILRTMGATQGMIMRIFFMVGASIGVVGTFVGTVIGVLFVVNIDHFHRFAESLRFTFPAVADYMSRLPAVLDWADVIFFVILSLTLSFLATLYPSWKAAQLDPVEALRYE